MARVNSPRVLRSGVLLLLLVAASVSTCVLLTGDQPERPQRATALQGWPSGTIIVNVTDDDGRPLVGATVKTSGPGILWQNQTGTNGTLVLTELPAGNASSPYVYSLNASMTGYRDSGTETALVVENETAFVDLVLYGGSILGTVTTILGGSSSPVVGANVSIAALGISTTVSPSSGAYKLAGLPAGTHSVSANASGYVPSSQDVVVPLGGSVLVNFVLISQNGSISGFVYHASSLAPLNNTNVSVQVGQVTITVTSGSDGSYNLTNIPEGTYTLTATKDGFYSGVLTNVVVTRGNRTADMDFFLTEKPTRLYGVVRSGTLLLVGVNVSVVGTTFYNLSGPDGNYEIRNLTADTYTIMATMPGYEPVIVSDVVIQAGGETQLNINFVGLPGAILRGTVLDANTGEPLRNVLVTIVDLEPQARSTFTNINGEFEFPGLKAGNYTVRFEKAGYRPLEISQVKVSEDQPTNRTIEMNPLRKGFGGFIFGFDMAHSMMILALFLTIVILAIAVYLRIRTFQTPENAPAVYDEAEEEEGAGEEKGPGGGRADDVKYDEAKLRKD